jgi:hypothetical protein
MKRKHFIAIFAVLVFAVSVLTAAGVSYKDTESPKISYGEETIHLDGTDVRVLLADVQAHDNKDGDVTNSLVISRLYPVSDNAGVVIYAAKDTSNNVSVKRRNFTFEEANKEAIFAALNIALEPGEADDSTDPNGSDADSNGNGAEPNGSDTDPNGNAAEPNGNGTNSNGGNPTGSNEPTDNLNGSLTDEEYAKLKAENQRKGYPFMRLKVHEVTLHVGDRFSIYTYISEVGDDVDTINTMLRLEHNVDTSKAGVYQAKVYARDSDGHVSNIEQLKVTVVGE